MKIHPRRWADRMLPYNCSHRVEDSLSDQSQQFLKRMCTHPHPAVTHCIDSGVLLISPQGYYKLLGRGHLPARPVIVKAKYFSKKAEDKIKKAGGVCLLSA